tara:strand:+ start:8462 stop:8989 length:528 start_codon:yes stop_codon:yes gene_type:complete
MIYHSKMNTDEKFKALCNLTTEMVGLPKGSLSCKSRKHLYQVPRAVVSMVARLEEDVHYTIIAKELKRDRSNIYHYEKMHESNLKSFKKYRDIFILITKAYSNVKQNQPKFKNLKSLKKFLIDNKIKSSEKFQTTLKLRVDNFHVNLKLSYKDFYNVIEIIKFTLADYDHEYKVI